MCQFNLVIIDRESEEDDLKQIFVKNGFGYRELEIENLMNQIGENQKIILTTKGECDCGSILGLNHQDLAPRIEVEKEKKKLRKKKWSESKIERYLNDKLKEQNKRSAESELGNESEERNWIKLFELLFKKNGKFGILFHQFDGLIEEEKIEIEKTNQISIELLKKGKMRNFKENQLNWIKK